jgi:transmembrane sensor
MMKELQDEEWLMIVKILKDECEPEERVAFEQWLRTDDENQKLFGRIQNDWKVSGNLPIADHPNADKVWQSISKEINSEEKKGKTIAFIPQWIRYAAAVALLIAASVLLFKKGTKEEQSYISSTESMSFVTLEDGSKVWLAAHSSLAYSNFSASDTREVTLIGKAYFEIARDESKPFIISAGASEVQVLGTAFNLDATSSQEISVTVTHGSVSFSSSTDQSNKVVLVKGQIGRLNLENNDVSMGINEDLNFLSWKTGILTFENLPMDKVCQALRSHYGASITISDDLGSQIRLTATFDNQSLDEVAEIIAETLSISLIKNQDSYVFE